MPLKLSCDFHGRKTFLVLSTQRIFYPSFLFPNRHSKLLSYRPFGRRRKKEKKNRKERRTWGHNSSSQVSFHPSFLYSRHGLWSIYIHTDGGTDNTRMMLSVKPGFSFLLLLLTEGNCKWNWEDQKREHTLVCWSFFFEEKEMGNFLFLFHLLRSAQKWQL